MGCGHVRVAQQFINRDPGVRKADHMPAPGPRNAGSLVVWTWRAEAGDPPERAQDNPPPRPGGSSVFSSPIVGRWRRRRRREEALNFIPPGLIVAVLLVLIVSQLCYAFLPYRRRAYVPILVMTALGFGIGQLWDFLGLPSIRLGEANLLPALAFALLLQPLARFIPRTSREPKEPASGNSNPHT